MVRLTALVGALAFAIAGAPYRAEAQEPSERLSALLESTAAADAPGVALGVVKDGEIIFAGYRGLENLETRTAVGEQTRFNIASNAKQFTALTVLDLARSGRMSLDDDLRRHAPTSVANIEEPITIRQMIAHTSGLRDVYDLWNLEGRTWWRSFVSNTDAIALLGRQQGLNFTPGTSHLYSNSNYIVLTSVVEAVSGQSFEEQTAALFDRWGMTATAFQTDASKPIPNRARPYADFGNGWIEFPAVTSLFGDGWLFTTLGDQLLFEQRVQRGGDPLLAEAQTPIWASYGYGLEHAGSPGRRHIWHDGSTGAQGASLSRFPDCGLTVVAITNNGQVSTRVLVTQAAEILLGDCASAQARFAERPSGSLAAIADDVTGLYRQATGGSDIRIVATSDGLQREIEGRDPVRLIEEGAGLYRYESNPALRMAFDRTDEGLARLTILAAMQPASFAVRYPEAQTGSFDAWTGAYQNIETGARLEINAGADGPIVRLNGEPVVSRVLGSGALISDGGLLTAEGAESGIPSRLFFDRGRLRRVMFERVASAN